MMKIRRSLAPLSLAALGALVWTPCALQAQDETTADTIFAKVVKPLFDARCVECHGADKTKGRLRLDAPEHITKGGSEGDTIVPGHSADSMLILRVTLPDDDDERMPPEGDPLTPEQIEALKWWIDAKEASYEAKYVEAEVPEAVKKLAETAIAVAPTTEKPEEPALPEVPAADPAAMKPLQDVGVLVLPLAQNTNLLHVECVSVAKDINDSHAAMLPPLAPQLAWLYMNKTGITDEGMKHLAGLTQLRRLHLANTAITDAGVEHLAGLENLETLNLYGTQVTSKSLDIIAKLPKIKKVFLYSTNVEARPAFKFLQEHPDIDLNLGWEFEALKTLDIGMALHEGFDEKVTGEVKGGNVEYADGPATKAGTFDGKAFVVAGDLANFDRTEPFSVVAWVKPGEQDLQVIAARSDSADGERGWTFMLDQGALSFHMASDSADNAVKVKAKTPLSTDQWYYVGAAYDGSSKAEGVTLYVDGNALEAEAQQDNLTRTTKTYQVLHLGRRSDGPAFIGQLDDLRIYPHELSADQVGALFDRFDFKKASGEENRPEEEAAQAGDAETVTFVSLAAHFDDGSCCHKAHGKGEECEHPCCVEALKDGKVCAKCNPEGAKKES